MLRIAFSWGLENGIERMSSKTVKAAVISPTAVFTVWEFVRGSLHKCPEGLLLVLVVSLFLASQCSYLIEPRLLKTNFLGIVLILPGISFP